MNFSYLSKSYALWNQEIQYEILLHIQNPTLSFSRMTDATNFSSHYIESYAPVGLAQKFKLLEKDGHFNYTLSLSLTMPQSSKVNIWVDCDYLI
jgi:hypothetical protein